VNAGNKRKGMRAYFCEVHRSLPIGDLPKPLPCPYLWPDTRRDGIRRLRAGGRVPLRACPVRQLPCRICQRCVVA
jgi:hypothetical protein